MYKNFSSKKMTVESMSCTTTCGGCSCTCDCGLSTANASTNSDGAAQKVLLDHVNLLATGSIFG